MCRHAGMIALMNPDRVEYLVSKYDRPVPRYTSFPTAVQFTEVFGVRDLEENLANLAPCDPVSLYVHIPFCHALCHYCGCHTKVVGTDAPVLAYIDLLLQEIELVRSRIGRVLPVSRIHFGGGSPNFASPSQLARILDRFAAHFHFLPDVDIDMECDPRLLSVEKIKAYAAMGVGRVSLGVQDFNPRVQEAVNRIQPYDSVRRSVEDLRAAGIEKINFDLMIGLPMQTLDTVQETLAQVLTLRPSRIAVFPYAHVPWMKKHQNLLERFPMPDPVTRFRMNEAVHATLLAAGYGAIGIDHYALAGDALLRAQEEGRLHRNFQGYTDDDTATLLGFGLSSISQFVRAFAQNTTDAPTYRRAIEAGKIPVVRGLHLSTEDCTRRDAIEQIMCNFSYEMKDFPSLPFPYEALKPMAEDGLMDLCADGFIIPPEGRTFVRLAAACFDPYVNANAGRHAKAV